MSKPAGAMSSPYGDSAQDDMREHYSKMANAMATGTINEQSTQPAQQTPKQEQSVVFDQKSAVLELIQTNITTRVIVESVTDNEIIFSIVGQPTKKYYKITQV